MLATDGLWVAEEKRSSLAHERWPKGGGLSRFSGRSILKLAGEFGQSIRYAGAESLWNWILSTKLISCVSRTEIDTRWVREMP